MTSLKVVQWNCGGMKPSTKSTPLKLGAFDKNFPKASFDIATFVETHHKAEVDFPEMIKIYSISHHCIHTPATKEDPCAGIIILVAKYLNVLNVDIPIPGRLINFQIESKNKEIEYNFSAFYGQTSRNLNRDQVNENIKILTDKNCLGNSNVIIGDFNFCSQDIDRQRQLHFYDKVWKKPWEIFIKGP